MGLSETGEQPRAAKEEKRGGGGGGGGEEDMAGVHGLEERGASERRKERKAQSLFALFRD